MAFHPVKALLKAITISCTPNPHNSDLSSFTKYNSPQSGKFTGQLVSIPLHRDIYIESFNQYHQIIREAIMSATMTKRNATQSFVYSTRIDIPAEIRSQVNALLNQSLATAIDLKTQVKYAHWNVKGKDFYQLHLLFDEISIEVEEFIDLIAERITTLGGEALGTARIAAERSELPEYPFDVVDGMDHVAALADRLAIYAKSLRQNIGKTEGLGDMGTNDLFVEISRAIDKRLWFLEAHLQPSSDD
jgi:starvation-inducible DNA-binding protein